VGSVADAQKILELTDAQRAEIDRRLETHRAHPGPDNDRRTIPATRKPPRKATLIHSLRDAHAIPGSGDREERGAPAAPDPSKQLQGIWRRELGRTLRQVT